MTDALSTYFTETDTYPNKYKDIYVINNGVDSSCRTANIQLPENLYFTKGFHEGYKAIKNKKKYDGFYFVCSDVGCESGNDTVKTLVETLFSDESYGQIHAKCNSPHKVMYKLAPNSINDTVPFIEQVAPMIKTSTLEKIGFWDTDFILGWGPDFDYGYRVRQAGLKNVVTSLCQISQKGHVSHENYSEFSKKARKQMNSLMKKKYGIHWSLKLKI